MYADMQPAIDIYESRVRIERVKNELPVGANEAIRRSIKFREEACATWYNTEQAKTHKLRRDSMEK